MEPSLRKLWWTVPVAVVLLLIALGAVLDTSQEPPFPGTSYDASSTGFRATYLILESLRFPVSRAKTPPLASRTDSVRWVLLAEAKKEPRARSKDRQEDPQALVRWVQQGGTLLLADATGKLAQQLGVHVRLTSDNADTFAGNTGIDGVRTLACGTVRVEEPRPGAEVWARLDDRPLVSIHPRGRGRIWLLHHPEMLQNRYMREADNSVLLGRLATAMLAEDRSSIVFDEFVHGLRDKPTFVELLFQPPTLWVTLQGLLLLALLLWRSGVRFGAIRHLSATRRSREEFLDAFASLLERKGDRADAWRTVRDEWAREIEADLGLPSHTPAREVASEASRRRRVDESRLLAVLGDQPPHGLGPSGFLQSLNDLESCRREYFHGRNHR